MSSFSFFEEKKKERGKKYWIATVSQSSVSIHHWVAFLLFFLIMKPLSIYTAKRVRPGTSAACERDETKTGPWGTRPRSAWSVEKWFFKHATIIKKREILFGFHYQHCMYVGANVKSARLLFFLLTKTHGNACVMFNYKTTTTVSLIKMGLRQYIVPHSRHFGKISGMKAS